MAAVEPFVPKFGVCIGSVAAQRGRVLRVVHAVYRGEAQITIFCTFPSDDEHPQEMTRINASYGPSGARALAALLLASADAAEAAAPQRPAREVSARRGDRDV